MTIPDYQTLMLPFLQLTQDQHEHTINEMFEKLGSQFELSHEERNELLASGKQIKFENRIHWAKTYLQKAGLVESTGRARFKITPKGLEALSEKPGKINVRFLMKYPEFVEFHRRTHKEDEKINEEINQRETIKTPEEAMEESYQNLRQALSQELLEKVKTCSPRFFENLVVDLLLAMGYGGSRKDAGTAIGRSGDGGVDGIIKEDKLGLDVVYLQAKRWENTIGAPEVQAFAGSLEGFRARKGVMITTSKFSPRAYEYIQRIEKRIILIDGEQLTQFMIDHEIGVAEINHYSVKRLDLDYFEE